MRILRSAVPIFFAWIVATGEVAAESSRNDPMEPYRDYQKAALAHDLAAALKHAKRAYELAEKTWGASERRTALFAANYGDQLCGQNSYEKGVELYSRCSQILNELGQSMSADRAYCAARTSAALADLGKLPEAKDSLSTAIDVLTSLKESGDTTVDTDLGGLYLAYAAMESPRIAKLKEGKPLKIEDSGITESKAGEYAAKAEAIFESALGPKDLMTLTARVARAFAAEEAEDWRSAAAIYAENARRMEDLYGAESFFAKHSTLLEKRAEAMARHPELDADLKKTAADGRKASSEKCNFRRSEGSEIELCTIERQPPIYPPAALASWTEGFAVVSYDVAPDGSIQNISIAESWPSRIFDDSAIDAVRSWRYEAPKGRDGKVTRIVGAKTIVLFEMSQ